MENLIVPPGESVTQGGIWVVEFFPPSHYSAFHEALQKNGWDKENQPGLNIRNDCRAGHGCTSRQRILLVAYRDRGQSRYQIHGRRRKREKLPGEFALVELTAVQLGRSLTAVVAFVILSDRGGRALNKVWTAQHEPTLNWRGLRRPHVEGRYFAAMHATQRERQRLHDLARKWLAQRCGGFFAETEAGQPLIDFNLFSCFDPLTERASLKNGEPLRALGMEDNPLYKYVSPQADGLVLVPGDDSGEAPQL